MNFICACFVASISWQSLATFRMEQPTFLSSLLWIFVWKPSQKNLGSTRLNVPYSQVPCFTYGSLTCEKGPQKPLQRVAGTERILTQAERSHTCFWLQGWGHILQNIFPNMLQDNWNWQVKKCENEKEITSSEEHIPLCLYTLPMDLLCGAQDYSVCITSRIFSVMSEALTQAG